MANSKKINSDEFFLVVEKNGFVFRTKSKREANVIASWCDGSPVFFGIVKSSEYLVIQTTCKRPIIKSLSRIKLAKPQEKNLWYDVDSLDELNFGSKILDVYATKKKEAFKIKKNQ